jgi:flagellin
MYGAYVVSGVCSGVGNSAAPERGAAVAIIRELLRGNIADIYQSAHDASTAVCIIQTFVAAADAIGEKLSGMRALAKKASSPDYTRVQVEQMQEELKELAEEINEITDNTEYEFNKLLTAEGESISIRVTQDTKIDIFARDLGFNVEGADLTKDAAGALAEIKKAIVNLHEYRRYLDRQADRLADVTGVIESQLESVVEVDLSDFNPSLAEQTIGRVVNWVLEDASTLLDMQAKLIHTNFLFTSWSSPYN